MSFGIPGNDAWMQVHLCEHWWFCNVVFYWMNEVMKMSGSDKSVCIEFVGGYWDGTRLNASRNAKELFHEKTVLVNEPIELCGVWTEIETKKSLLVRYEWRGRTRWEDEVGLVKLFEMDRFMVLDTEGGIAADGLEVDGLGSVEMELDDFNGYDDV